MERIEQLISKEALAQFDELKAKVIDNVANFETLVTKAVEFNKTLSQSSAGYKKYKDDVKAVDDSQKELLKRFDELTSANAELQKKYDELAKKMQATTSESKKMSDTMSAAGNNISSNLGKSFDEVINKLIALNNQLKQNKAAQKELQSQKSVFEKMNKDLPEVQKGLAEIAKSETTLVAEEKQLRAAVNDTNKEIRKRVELDKTSEGSRRLAELQVNELRKERDFNINIDTEEGQQQLKELNAEIDKLNTFLEQTADKLGQRKINVGNYEGSAKIIVDAFEHAQKKVAQVSQRFGETSPEARAARRELEGLQRVVENPKFLKVSANFGDAQQETKFFTREVIKLEQAGLGSSEVVEELKSRLAQLTDEIGDTRAEIKAMSSDTRAFDLFASSVSSLVSVVQTGAGIWGLFADSEEEVAQVTQTLIAIENVSNGVRAIANELTTKGTAANKLYNFILGSTEKATKANTAATTAQAAATEGASIATTALTVGLKVLRGALIATGIGALVVGVTYLIEKLSQWKNADKELREEQIRLNAVLIEQINLQKELAGLTATDIGTVNQPLKNRLDLLRAQGKTQLEILGTEKQLLEERQKLANVRFFGTNGYAELAQLATGLQNARSEYEEFEKTRLKGGKTLKDEDFDEEKNRLQGTLNLFKAKYAEQKDIVEEFVNSNTAINAKEAEIEKAIIDQNRKDEQARLEMLKRRLQFEIETNLQIADSEYNSLEKRNAAREKAFALSQRISLAEKAFALGEDNLSKDQRANIIDEANKKIATSYRETYKQIADLTREYAKREATAQQEILQTGLQMISDRNQRIADNEELSVTARLEANKKYFDAQKALIVEQTDYELQNKTLLESERKAIQQKSNADMLNLQVDFLKRSNDINTAGLDRSMQDTIKMNSTRVNKQLADLAQQREDGLIGEKDYQEKRTQIEFAGAQNDLKILISQTKAKISVKQAENKNVKDLLDQLAEYERQLNESSLENTKATEEKKFQARMEAVQKFGQLATNIFSAINEINQIEFDGRQKNIEEETAAIEKKYQVEVDAINNSALTEEEKETKLHRLEMTYNAQKQAQEIKMKQLEMDRARAERAMTIQRIIADTAAAVISALGAKPWTPVNIALAATVGALGAAQLARVIATPLPAFAEGTDNAPGGLAWVGDGGRRELVQQKDGKSWLTPDRPTIMNVPKGSIVHPDARKILEAGVMSSLSVNRLGRLVEAPGMSTAAIENKIDKLTNVIKNKRELNLNANQGGMTAIWKWGANSIRYTQDQIKW